MRQITWTDRLFDESNLWLKALRTEEEGNCIRAAALYLQDSEETLSRNQLAKAALSCSCAAGCLEKVSDLSRSRLLYTEAGALYHENAFRVMADSVREALWSLREAYKCFMRAQLTERAVESRQLIESLNERVDPFQNPTQTSKVPRTEPNSSVVRNDKSINSPKNSEIAQAVEKFLAVRRSRSPRSPTNRLDKIPNNERRETDAEDFTRKLG